MLKFKLDKLMATSLIALVVSSPTQAELRGRIGGTQPSASSKDQTTLPIPRYRFEAAQAYKSLKEKADGGDEIAQKILSNYNGDAISSDLSVAQNAAAAYNKKDVTPPSTGASPSTTRTAPLTTPSPRSRTPLQGMALTSNPTPSSDSKAEVTVPTNGLGAVRLYSILKEKADKGDKVAEQVLKKHKSSDFQNLNLATEVAATYNRLIKETPVETKPTEEEVPSEVPALKEELKSAEAQASTKTGETITEKYKGLAEHCITNVAKYEEEIKTLKKEMEVAKHSSAGASQGKANEETGSGSEKNLTASQLLNGFKTKFAAFGYDERVIELEQLINKLIEIGGGEQSAQAETLDLFKFLHNFRDDPKGDEKTKQFCTFFLTAMEENSIFASAAAAYNKWLKEGERKLHLIHCGEAWNKVRGAGDIKKYSYSSTQPYIKDNTAIPLINLLTKDFMALLKKTDPAQLRAWGELIPFTPHDVILAIYYNILKNDLDDEAKVEKNFGGEGLVKNKGKFISAFVDQVKTAALEVGAKFKKQDFQTASPEKQKLKDSQMSIVGGPARVDVWHAIPNNPMPEFNKATMERSDTTVKIEHKRKFLFNRNDIVAYVPDYVAKAPSKEVPVAKGIAKLTDKFKEDARQSLEEVLGREPKFQSEMFAEMFYKKIIKETGDVSKDKIKEHLKKLKDEGHLSNY